MTTHNSTDTKEEIRRRLKLSDLIEPECQKGLKSAGSNRFRAFCPVHGSDHQRSLSIDDGTGRFQCFACGIKGDCYAWIMLRQNVEFREALQIAGKMVGVEVENKESAAAKKRRGLHALINEIGQHYHRRLPDEMREVIEQRWGLTSKTVDAWRIGWADGSAQKTLGFSAEAAKATGLFDSNKQGDGIYEALKGRITFPWSENGQVVYMVGRILQGEPPWRNQTVSKAVPKPLWGADSLTGAERVLIVEGIPDALAGWQCREALGHGWAFIACGGQELRSQDAELIAKRTQSPQIFLCLDGDDAGVAGTITSARLLIGHGVQEIHVLKLEGAKDLADWLRAHSAEDFNELVNITVASDSPFRLDIWRFWAHQFAHKTQAQILSHLDSEVYPVVKALGSSYLEIAAESLFDVLKIPKREILNAVKAISRKSDTLVQRTKDWFREFYAVLGHEHTETGNSLVCWSKRYRRIVKLSLEKPSALQNRLFPDMGDLAEQFDRIMPKGTQKQEALGVLVSALAQLGQDSASFGRMVRLRNGLHVLDSGLVLISQSRAYRKPIGGEWESVIEPAIGNHLLEARETDQNWLEFDTAALSAPLIYTPAEVYELFLEALLNAWTWLYSDDAQLIALAPFACTWASLFPSKPWIHLLGPAESGKTAQGFGFLGGAPGMTEAGGPFIPTAGREEQTSAAGMISKYSHTSQTIIVDEADPSEREIQKLLNILRNSGITGTGVLRGTPDGGYREDYLYVPAVFVGTEDWQKDPDTTRWLTIEFPPDSERTTAPQQTLYEFWREKGIDTRELRRTVLLAFTENYPELRATYKRLQQPGTIPGEELVSGRQRANMLPFFACAEIIGLDLRDLGQSIFRVRSKYKTSIQRGRIERQLIETLITGTFLRDNHRRLCVSEIQANDTMPVETAPYGVAIVRNDSEQPHLCVNWGNAQVAGPLRGTQFRTEKYSVKELAQIAKNAPGFIGTRQRRIGHIRGMWAEFDWNELSGEEADAPSPPGLPLDDEFRDDTDGEPVFE